MKNDDKKQDSNEVIEAARAYLRKGWYPVPIPAGNKGPVLPGWQQLRITEAEVSRHFGGARNIGLLLGSPSSGLIDVDVDHAMALALTGRLPATGRVHGRGAKPRSHYWYRASGAIPETKRFKDPVTNETLIEFRSTGGQTVVPPSVYAIDGKEDRLTWVQEGDPATVDGALLRQSVSEVAACALVAKHYPSASGSRHDIALALAGFLLRGGMDVARAEQFVEAMCDAAGDEEVADRVKAVADTAGRLTAELPATGRARLEEFFDKRIVERAAEWLGLKAQADPVTWEAPIGFDEVRTPEIAADVLPGAFSAFAKALAETAEVPESMTTMATLGAVSAAVTKKFKVAITGDWLEPLNIYSLTALPPANNKSYVLREVIGPIESWEADRFLEMQSAIRAAVSTRRNEESLIVSLRAKAARNDKPEQRAALFAEVTELEGKLTKVPVPPKVYINDATPEALAAAISEQEGRIAIISDEGGMTETLAGLYSSGRANYDVLLKGYDGGTLRLKRKDREIDLRPYISVLLLVQPQVLRNMAQQKAFAGRGLFERFFYLLPTSKLGFRTLNTRPIPGDVRTAYSRELRRLLDLPVLKHHSGADEPTLLRLSPGAAELFAAYRHEIEPALSPEGRLRVFAGWAGKLAGNCARVAGLLHVAEHGTSTLTISRETMDRAILLCRALTEHALAAHSMMELDRSTQDAADLYNHIRERGEPLIGRTELLRRFHGRFTNKRRFDAALETLRHHNIISDLRKGTDPQTGRQRGYYEVNPMLFTRKS